MKPAIGMVGIAHRLKVLVVSQVEPSGLANIKVLK